MPNIYGLVITFCVQRQLWSKRQDYRHGSPQQGDQINWLEGSDVQFTATKSRETDRHFIHLQGKFKILSHFTILSDKACKKQSRK